MRLFLVFFLTLFLLPLVTHADQLEDGKEAYDLTSYRTAKKLLQPLADQGNAEAQIYIDAMHKNDQFEEGQAAYARADYQTALKIWLPMADQGNAEAQYKIAMIYDFGQGVKQDYAVAARWFQKTADLGWRKSQVRIGEMYMLGQGGKQDLVKAYMWLSLATKATDLKDVANEELDRISTKMTPEQIAEANRRTIEWKPIAAPQATATLHVHELQLRIMQGDAQALTILKTKAEEGNLIAQYDLGDFYMIGNERNYEEAAKWYRMAAEQGYARAADNLAGMYVDGKGVKQDYVEAYFWYSLAASQSFSYEREKHLAAKLITPEQAATAEKRAKETIAAYAEHPTFLTTILPKP